MSFFTLFYSCIAFLSLLARAQNDTSALLFFAKRQTYPDMDNLFQHAYCFVYAMLDRKSYLCNM